MAIQEAARNKAKVKAETARQNIENMMLKAKSGGYVSVQQNTNGNFMSCTACSCPMLQVGDTVNAGMAVAQIPDLKNWEVTASIGELDRGHLSVGPEGAGGASWRCRARSFNGTVKEIGGTIGAFWDRHFDCKIALEQVVAGHAAGHELATS